MCCIWLELITCSVEYEALINMHESVCMDDYIYAISIIALHVHEDIA